VFPARNLRDGTPRLKDKTPLTQALTGIRDDPLSRAHGIDERQR
jgi:hypothetical protein